MPETDPTKKGRLHYGTGSTYEFRFGYSRGVRQGDLIRIAGTAGLGADGNVVSDDVAEQTRRSLQIIEEALRDLGAEMSDVIMTRIYVSDASDIETVAVIHGEAFRDIRPATSIVKVGFIDPRILVEIEAEAACGGAGAGARGGTTWRST